MNSNRHMKMKAWFQLFLRISMPFAYQENNGNKQDCFFVAIISKRLSNLIH